MMRPDDNEMMTAGSLRAIVYVFFQLLDELSHAIGLDNFEAGYRFCQWTHRYDWCREREKSGHSPEAAKPPEFVVAEDGA